MNRESCSLLTSVVTRTTTSLSHMILSFFNRLSSPITSLRDINLYQPTKTTHHKQLAPADPFNLQHQYINLTTSRASKICTEPTLLQACPFPSAVFPAGSVSSSQQRSLSDLCSSHSSSFKEEASQALNPLVYMDLTHSFWNQGPHQSTRQTVVSSTELFRDRYQWENISTLALDH